MTGSSVPSLWRDKRSTLVVTAMVVVAAITAAFALFGGPKAPAAPATSEPSVTASESPSPSPSANPTQGPAQTGPVDSAKGLTPIEPSAPLRLQFGDVDAQFDSTIDQPGDLLTPSTPDEVSRLGYRARPGSPGRDTVVMVGALGDGNVFASLPDLAVDDTVTLTTANGTLSYTVRESTQVAAADAQESDQIIQKRPGRLVLVGAGYDDDQRSDQDLLVVADLTEVTAN